MNLAKNKKDGEFRKIITLFWTNCQKSVIFIVNVESTSKLRITHLWFSVISIHIKLNCRISINIFILFIQVVKERAAKGEPRATLIDQRYDIKFWIWTKSTLVWTKMGNIFFYIFIFPVLLIVDPMVLQHSQNQYLRFYLQVVNQWFKKNFNLYFLFLLAIDSYITTLLTVMCSSCFF